MRRRFFVSWLSSFGQIHVSGNMRSIWRGGDDHFCREIRMIAGYFQMQPGDADFCARQIIAGIQRGENHAAVHQSLWIVIRRLVESRMLAAFDADELDML